MNAEANWSRNIVYSAEQIVAPTTLDELRNVLSRASSAKALGSRHSFTRIADTTGTLISTHALAVGPQLDTTRRRVRVSAGARYGEIARWLDERGWALANLASLPHISVAGAISTGTHGSGLTNRSLAAAVAAVEMMTSDGDVVRIERGGEQFEGVVVSLGALGILTAVELDIEESFDVAQTIYEGLPLEVAVGSFDEILGGAYSASLFTTFRAPDTVDQVWYKVRLDEAGRMPDALTGREAPGPRHPLPGVDARSCTEQGGVPGRWLDRLPHFRLEFTPSNGDELQSEYLLPRSHAPEALAALRSLADVISPVLQVCEIRTVAADTRWLSPAFERDTVAFHFTWLPDTAAVLAVLPEIESAFAPFGARPHWGKLFSARLGESVGDLYPRWSAFTALRRELDPRGVFLNDFLRGVGL